MAKSGCVCHGEFCTLAQVFFQNGSWNQLIGGQDDYLTRVFSYFYWPRGCLHIADECWMHEAISPQQRG
jgi:hypothetical protein